MKNLELKFPFFKRYAILLLVTVSILFITILTIFSCTKADIEKTSNKILSVPKSLTFEKQFIVNDKSGNNSVTLRISTDCETLLADYTASSFELHINPVIPEDTPIEELQNNFEKPEPLELQEDIQRTSSVIQIDIIDVNFKNKVNNYSLVMHGPFELEAEKEDTEKINLCRWFPRDVTFYEINNVNALKIKTTFAKSKNTCNNIEYYICKFGYPYYSYINTYQLKHPGDEVTTSVWGEVSGLSVYYRRKKNSIPTYEYYY